MTCTLVAGTATDVGGRTTNEDALTVSERLFAVADGLGGLELGEVASRLTLDTLAVVLGERPSATGLLDAGREANDAMWRRGKGRAAGVGTTLTALAIIDDAGAMLLHVGDARRTACAREARAAHRRPHRDGRPGPPGQPGGGGGELAPAPPRAHARPGDRTVGRRRPGGGRSGAGGPVAAVHRRVLCTDGLFLGLGLRPRRAAGWAGAAAEPQTCAEALVSGAVTAGTSDNATAVAIDVADATCGGVMQPSSALRIVWPVGSDAARQVAGERPPGQRPSRSRAADRSFVSLEDRAGEDRPVQAVPPTHRRRRGRRRHQKTSLLRRRIRAGLLLVLTGFLVWVAISMGFALTNPTLGVSLPARAAEWVRQNGGAGVVRWIENEWYSHHAPKVGGAPPPGAIRKPVSTSTVPVNTGPPHLPAPPPITPFASPPLPGEGDWSPVGRPVGGIPAVYETTLRPDAVHTSYVVGVAWMDTKLLKATLYSGSQIPGGGPYPHTAPVQPTAARSLVAAFNAGFLMSTANGGYYTDGRTVLPLRQGAASAVIYKNGSITIGAWGQNGLTMSPNVVSVRQNLSLLVNNGKPVAGLTATTTTRWGATLGNAVYVWRSGAGVTADGALVYVGGPGLNITDLANILARAGCVRAMELDINTTWVNYTTFKPSTPTGPANGTNGSLLLPQMAGTTARYFQTWWARDFFTMSAR